MDSTSSVRPSATSSLYYKPSGPDALWDTSLRYHDGTYYLYHLRGTWAHEATGLATSPDGVHWTDRGRLTAHIGYGASWPVVDASGAVRFLCPLGRSTGEDEESRGRMAESANLIDWTILEDSPAPADDEGWFHTWGAPWLLARPEGGFYAYGGGQPRGVVGFGVAESDDGLSWTPARPPVLIEGTTVVPDRGQDSVIEVSVVHEWGGRYYALMGLKDLDAMSPVVDGVQTFNPGETTMIADSPFGPFRPAPKNRRVLVGNNAYYIGFAETPDGLLANFHVWEADPDEMIGVILDQTYLSPLKRVVWDDDGTLRLRWWEGNDRAKTTPIPLAVPSASSATLAAMIDPALDVEDVLILEGTFTLPAGADAPRVGLYFEGDDADGGAAMLVDHRGVMEYGPIGSDGSGFVADGYVDREVDFGPEVRFRLIRKRRMTEIYLDDHLMMSYSLPQRGTGRLGLIGPAGAAHDITGWHAS